MVRAREIAASKGCLASVGIVEAKPGSVNTVPGLVNFSLDIRGPETDMVQVVEAELKKEFDAIAAEEGKGIGKPCRVEWTLDFDSPAIKFHESCIDCVQQSAGAVVTDAHVPEPKSLVRTIMSGAGHDSVFTSKRVPTSMIFVPCKDGLSHHPEEYCSADDCATGASVILQSVIRYDRKRFSAST